MGKTIDFLLSLKTAFGLFLAGTVICLIGSLMLPANLAFFSGIDDTPLFQWLRGAGDLKKTWWIYVLMVQMGVLALSTVLCTADALLKRATWRHLFLKLSPQVMHAGVLFVMLGHLLTASMGIKTDVSIAPGEKKALSDGVVVFLENLDVKTDEKGYYSDWMARLWLLKDGQRVKEALLRPAHPLYFGKLGLYFKTIKMGEEPSALIRVCLDPGALWALLGGVLVLTGGLGFMYARFTD